MYALGGRVRGEVVLYMGGIEHRYVAWFLRFSIFINRPLLALCSRCGPSIGYIPTIPKLYQLKSHCINAQLKEKQIFCLMPQNVTETKYSLPVHAFLVYVFPINRMSYSDLSLQYSINGLLAKGSV